MKVPPRSANSDPCAVEVIGLCLSLFVTACCTAIVSGAEERSSSRFRESVALETDFTAQKQLETTRFLLQEKRWKEAIDIIRDVQANHPAALIALGAGRYLNAVLYSQLLLASLPPEGLVLARKGIDESARQAYREAVRDHDEGRLAALVRESFVSRATEDALLTLGEWAWESGHIARARVSWEKLVPPARSAAGHPTLVLRYPDARVDQASILARLVVCSIVDGDPRRGEAELDRFQQKFPQARGTLGGQPGRLVNRLEQIAADAHHWTFPPRDTAVGTFGVNASRNGVLPKEIDVGAIRWVAEVSPPSGPSALLAGTVRDSDDLSLFPVIYRDVIAVSTGDQILAWNWQTGKPAWPGGHNDGPVIYPTVTEPKPGPVLWTPSTQARQTMTVYDGRLFARLSDAARPQMRDELPESNTHLVCLDLKRGEGKLLWKVDAAGLADPVLFEGSPAVAGGRAYVSVRRGRPQMQNDVLCLDAESGRRLWQRFVCATVGNGPLSEIAANQNLLTLGDDAVFLATGDGAIAALEADTGVLRWAVTYPRNVGESFVPFRPTQSNPPCLFSEDRVFTQPADSNTLLAIESRTGFVLWKRFVPGGVTQLLGVKNGVLIVSGRSLWGLDAANGRVIWHVGFADPTTFGYGRGVLAGEVVYWPTREDVFVVDQQTGHLRRRIPLLARYGEGGGNVLLAGDHFIVAQPHRILVFGPESGRGRKSGELYTGSDGNVSPRLLSLHTAVGRMETGLFDPISPR